MEFQGETSDEVYVELVVMGSKGVEVYPEEGSIGVSVGVGGE